MKDVKESFSVYLHTEEFPFQFSSHTEKCRMSQRCVCVWDGGGGGGTTLDADLLHDVNVLHDLPQHCCIVEHFLQQQKTSR
jgi:hypothetical protein